MKKLITVLLLAASWFGALFNLWFAIHTLAGAGEGYPGSPTWLIIGYPIIVVQIIAFLACLALTRTETQKERVFWFAFPLLISALSIVSAQMFQ